MPQKITLTLTDHQVHYLTALRFSEAMGGPTSKASLETVLAYVVASVADGVRRPGSWERQSIEPMFGSFPYPQGMPPRG